jgi:chromosomal replication initiation ATPase DnaA
MTDARSFPEAADGLPQVPMEAELWAAGCDLETARFVAKQLARDGYTLIKGQPKTARGILREVADAYSLSFDDLLNDSKQKRFAWPRGVAYTRIYEETALSYPQIAAIMKRKCHTTVVHGVKATRKRIMEGKMEWKF